MDAQEPPAIDLKALGKLQRIVQYAAAAAVVVTLVLTGLASSHLASINRELTRKTDALSEADQLVKTRQAQIADLDAKIAQRNNALRALESPQPAITTDTPAKVARTLPARVYVQIFDETQRPHARELQSALEAAGFVVPGIENVGNTRAVHQAVSDVRFYDNATDMTDVANIQQIASRFAVTLKATPLSASTGVRPRHYEVWLGRDFR